MKNIEIETVMVFNLSKKDPATRRALKIKQAVLDPVMESPCYKILDL